MNFITSKNIKIIFRANLYTRTHTRIHTNTHLYIDIYTHKNNYMAINIYMEKLTPMFVSISHPTNDTNRCQHDFKYEYSLENFFRYQISNACFFSCFMQMEHDT